MQPIPYKSASPAETALREALRQDARTHLGRMFAPIQPDAIRRAVSPLNQQPAKG